MKFKLMDEKYDFVINNIISYQNRRHNQSVVK